MQQEFAGDLNLTDNEPQKKGYFSKAMDFGKKLFKKKQVTTEDVKQVFTVLLAGQRTLRTTHIREQDRRLLGRYKKHD